MQDLPKELSSVFLTFNTVVSDLSNQKLVLGETLSSLEITKAPLSVRESELLSLREAFSKLEDQKTSLDLQLGSTLERAAELDKRVAEFQETVNERGLLLRSTEYELENLKSEHSTTSFERVSLKGKVKELEKSLLEASGDRSLLREQLAHQTDERDQLAKAYEALSTDASQTRHKALASSGELDEQRVKFVKLETEWQSVVAENRSLREALVNAENLQAKTAHTYDSKLGALSSRLRVSEKLLEQSRAEARKLSEEQLVAYTQLRELEEMPAKLSTVVRNLDQNKKRLKDYEAEKERLMSKAAELTEKVLSKDRLNAQAAERITSLQDMISRFQTERDRRESEFKKEIEARDEALAKERVERAYTEGVLETARRDRSQLHQPIVALRARANNSAPDEEMEQVTHNLEGIDDLKSMLRENDSGVLNLRTSRRAK